MAVFFVSLPVRYTCSLEGTVEVVLLTFFYVDFYLYFFFSPCSAQYDVKSDESNSSSIIFAEFTSEEEQSLRKPGVEDNQNNELVNYSSSVVSRDAGDFELSLELRESDVADGSSRPIVGRRLPLQHNSDPEENFASTEESSEENLNLLGQTEVSTSPRTCRSAVSRG